MNKILILLSAFCVALMGFEESKGSVAYGRHQTSFHNNKENVCFKLPGAATKYRLGNECETWLEFGIYQDVEFENGIKLHNQVRSSFSGENEKSIDFVRWEEFYTEVYNLIESNRASFWIGRKYHERYDSYMSDYFFLNMNGTGLGVRDLEIADGLTFSYSYIFDDLVHDSFEGDEYLRFNSHDIRFIQSTQSGDITLFLNYMHFSDKSFKSGERIDASDGFALGLLYENTKITKQLFGMDGNNISGLFYGNGAAKNAGSSSSYLQDSMLDTILGNNSKIDEAETVRFINYGYFQNDRLGFMTNLVYEKRDESKYSNIKQDWFSIGIRPYLPLNENIRFLADAGFDKVDDKINNKSYELTKMSFATEFAFAKGVWRHPVLRIYYTYAEWSDSAKGSVGTDYYADKTSGDNAGIQIEYWW